jgi:hypothetical protein
LRSAQYDQPSIGPQISISYFWKICFSEASEMKMKTYPDQTERSKD